MAFLNQQTMIILIACVAILWWTTDYTTCDPEDSKANPLPHDSLVQDSIGKETEGHQDEETYTSVKPKMASKGNSNDEIKQQRIKEIVTKYQSQVSSHPPQSSCPGWSVWSKRVSDNDYSFASVGSLFLPSPDNTATEFLLSVVRDIEREFLPKSLPLFVQLGSNFGGSGMDASTAHSLSSLLRSLGVSVLSLANNAVEGRVGVMDTFVHALQANQVEWVGLRAKSSSVVTVGGGKVGFLAFCTSYAKCKGDSSMPLMPAKYSESHATSAVKHVKKMGAEAIIVLMYWGKSHSLSPSDHTLSVARHLSHLNVSLVLGDFPTLPQNHAYFKKTLIVFSPGQLILQERDLCWQTYSDGLEFKEDIPECNAIPPSLRQIVRQMERQTRLYSYTIRRGGHITAEYKTLQLKLAQDVSGDKVLRPVPSEGQGWIPVCSSQDANCLSCVQF